MEDARALFDDIEMIGSAGCWRLAKGHFDGKGYRRLLVSGKEWLIHRLAYTLFVGPIPDGLTLDHLCHTNDLDCAGGNECPHRACCNPDHLEPVTIRVNLLRGRGIPAKNARKRTCDEGHSLVWRHHKGRIGRYCPKCQLKKRIAAGTTSGNGSWASRNHCLEGHPYDKENTAIYSRAGKEYRLCKTCSRRRSLEYRRKINGTKPENFRAKANP